MKTNHVMVPIQTFLCGSYVTTRASVLRSWRVRRPDGSRSDFAVHRDVDGTYCPRDWTVTHVPSGMAITRPMGGLLLSQRDAYRWARCCIDADLEEPLAGLHFGSRDMGGTGDAARAARRRAESLYRRCTALYEANQY